MRRFVNILTTGFFVCLLLGNVAAKKKRDDDKPKAKATPAVPGPKFDVPIPVGHDAEVVKLPSYRSNGTLEMLFSIALAKRSDLYHLQMSSVKVETYDEQEKKDMTIDLATSVLDLNTFVIDSKEPVKVKNRDFELVGDTMNFNTKTRKGSFIGHVRMLIFNRDSMTSKEQTK